MDEDGDAYDDYREGWFPYSIVEKAPGRIFVDRKDHLGGEYSFNRSGLEEKGFADYRDVDGWKRFYTDEGRAAADARWARNPHEVTAIHPDESAMLGISGDCTRSDIERAFRRQSKVHHPDQGGSDEAFRRLVEAKDKALSRLDVFRPE